MTTISAAAVSRARVPEAADRATALFHAAQQLLAAP